MVVVALLAALGVWFQGAGPVGDLFTWMLRGSLGVVAVAFPLVGVYWGTLLLRDAAREDRVRMFIGSSVLGLGLLGIVSLLGGKPGPRDGYDAVSVAGGVLGAAVAHPLTIVISAVGAFIVCLGMGAVGLLIFTGTPISVEMSGEMTSACGTVVSAVAPARWLFPFARSRKLRCHSNWPPDAGELRRSRSPSLRPSTDSIGSCTAATSARTVISTLPTARRTDVASSAFWRLLKRTLKVRSRMRSPAR